MEVRELTRYHAVKLLTDQAGRIEMFKVFTAQQLALSLLVGSIAVAQAPEERYARFIPEKATVQATRSYDPESKKETDKTGIKFGRLGKSAQDIVFIYKLGDELHLRIVEDPNRKPVTLDRVLPGTFVWMQDYKTNGLQVRDLDGQPGDEILTLTAEGLSLGAYMNVFAVRNGRLESVLENPPARETRGYDFEVEPDHNAYKIVVYTDKNRSKVETSRWNGKKFYRVKS